MALQETLQEHETLQPYDLIASNPPFYQADPRAPEKGRSQARQAIHLPSVELLKHTSRLLSATGSFHVILPENVTQRFILQAADTGLYLKRQCLIYPKDAMPANRRLMEFVRHRSEVSLEELTIRHEMNYSGEFHSFTAGFLLNSF